MTGCSVSDHTRLILHIQVSHHMVQTYTTVNLMRMRNASMSPKIALCLRAIDDNP